MSIKVIHIFGYGEIQIIGKDSNKKTSISNIHNYQSVVDDIFSKKPQNLNATNQYHSINIFVGSHADFIVKNKDENSFRVKYSELDENLIIDLIQSFDNI